MTTRENFASRLGFILMSAGCAIGLGNVWRFPYIVGQNGGGLFVLLYLKSLVLLAIPVLVMEFATGRAAQQSIIKVHTTLTPPRKGDTSIRGILRRIWPIHGVAGALGNLILMMFYATVTGWMFIYFFFMASGTFSSAQTTVIPGTFDAMLKNWPLQAAAMAGVVVAAAAVCAMGIRKGLERVSKFLMIGLFVLIVVLAVNSLRFEGALEGVKFYLVPNLERVREIGFARIEIEAMNQAFFTLSLGIGAMSIFGSYISRKRALFGEALNVGLLDTFVALLSGLIILPACFAFHVEPNVGPGLVFVTLPHIFNQMPFGRVWGSLFFLFLSMAAFTTVLGVFEVILACLCDFFGISRGKGTIFLAAAIIVLSLPCIFGFNLWSSFQPLGANTNVLDLEDLIVSNFLLPLGALCFVLYTTLPFGLGWGWKNFLAEANAGSGLRVSGSILSILVRIYCMFVLPLAILTLFIVGLYERFKS